jgi:hypothetical protein
MTRSHTYVWRIPHSRESESTIGRELELANTYLKVIEHKNRPAHGAN